MQANTTIRRTMRGDLQALTVITLDPIARRELHTTTDKHCNGGLSSDAIVYRITADGRGREHAFSYDGVGDFRRMLDRAPKVRATEKAIRTMHETALAQLPAIIEQARAHYSAQPVAEVQS